MNLSTPAIVNGTLWTLALCSLITWSVILYKSSWFGLNALRNRSFLKSFQPGSLPSPDHLAAAKAPLARVYQVGLHTLSRARPNASITDPKPSALLDLLERSLRQQVQKERSRMDSGLGLLASIGSTSPFIGLFGTVWGIMHALQDISHTGSASLEVVAGPIGEALVATALGIAVAIPAVLGYNLFVRQTRRVVATLDHFASDFLHTTIEQHFL